jgi:hypothetical protein
MQGSLILASFRAALGTLSTVPCSPANPRAGKDEPVQIAGISFIRGALRSAIVGATASWGAAAIAQGSPQEEIPDAGYEIWALDQGAHRLHIYSSTLELVEEIDLTAKGVSVPHMIDLTSDHA